MTTARIIRSLSLLALISILISFFWLLLHNQSHSEYLIFIDFWFNYDSLANGADISRYLFHHVHTYAVVSLAWYLDVWLAAGSLRLFHALQLGIIVAAFACLPGLSLRLYNATSPHQHTIALGTAAMAMSLWLSPSNSFGLTYPLVGFLASSLLLFMMLYAVAIHYRTNPRSNAFIWMPACVVIATLGFFSFETFVVAPLFLILDSLLRRRHRDALFHGFIATFLLILYVTLQSIEAPVSASNISPDVAFLSFIHNFLVFLSMHVWMVFFEFGVDANTAAAITIAVSLVQLTLVSLFGALHYRADSRTDQSTRFAFLLVAVGASSIALATWLRFPDEIVSAPVRRYTPYSIMVSMGVLFLSVRAMTGSGGKILRTVAFTAVFANGSYLLADTMSLWFRSGNPAASFAHIRLEMPIYAVSPGEERLFPPGSHEGYLPIRKRVHPFLEEAGLSIFANPGYLMTGQTLPPLNPTEGASCTLMWEGAARYNRPQYTTASFRLEELPDNGIFLAADPKDTIVAFGLSARLHPLQRNTQSLLPKRSDDGPLRYYYVPAGTADVAAAVPCAQLWDSSGD